MTLFKFKTNSLLLFTLITLSFTQSTEEQLKLLNVKTISSSLYRIVGKKHLNTSKASCSICQIQFQG